MADTAKFEALVELLDIAEKFQALGKLCRKELVEIASGRAVSETNAAALFHIERSFLKPLLDVAIMGDCQELSEDLIDLLVSIEDSRDENTNLVAQGCACGEILGTDFEVSQGVCVACDSSQI